MKDSAQVLRYMTDVADDSGACVVLVHHTGWDNKGRARGGSQLEANPDNVIVFARSEDPTVPVSIYRKKDKEGEAGLKVWVDRRLVAESCVLELAEPPEDKKPARGPDAKSVVLRYVDDADPFTYTVSGLEKAIGGNHDRARAAVASLIEEGVLTTKQAAAREGNRDVTRERIGRAAPITPRNPDPTGSG